MNIENMSLRELAEQQERHRQQLAENRRKIQDRKQRTKRLIVHGAIAESFIPNACEMDEITFKNYLLQHLN